MSSEKTLILIKPDGVRRGLVGEVISRVEEKGYSITALRMLHADRVEILHGIKELKLYRTLFTDLIHLNQQLVK